MLKKTPIFLLITYLSGAQAIDTPLKGIWQTQKDEKNARIEIADCTDDSTKLCGKIVWLESPTYPPDDPRAGQPKLDLNNIDESLRSRQILGLSMLTNFEAENPTKFINGKIYNPEDGETYNCTLTLNNPDQLDVYGHVDLLLFTSGKTQYWKRVKTPVDTSLKTIKNRAAA